MLFSGYESSRYKDWPEGTLKGNIWELLKQILLIQMPSTIPQGPDPFMKIKRFLSVWKTLTCRKAGNRWPEAVATVSSNCGCVSNARKMPTIWSCCGQWKITVSQQATTTTTSPFLLPRLCLLSSCGLSIRNCWLRRPPKYHDPSEEGEDREGKEQMIFMIKDLNHSSINDELKIIGNRNSWLNRW